VSTLAALIGSILFVFLVASLLLAWLWRRTDDESRGLVLAIWKLPLRKKIRLARSLAGDRRIPLLVRLLPPAMVLYLAMPLDVIPDFIPILGQADDVLVAAVGIVLLLRLTPRHVLEEKLRALER
jgi:uncharacterized membrane protein YkvA (DUF1232 family)